MLQVENLRKVYAAKVAVNDVSFSVDKGEIFGLLGPNGAGKTTSIRMALSIILPDSGRVLFDGNPFTEETKNRVGYLPEERGLYRKNRLGDTIAYFGSLKNMRPAEIKKQSDFWLKKFELKGNEKSKVEELSKGNQQKVQFIISILHNPEMLILDEPFAGFDPINQDLLKEILIELKNQGKTIIFSTHQMEQVEKLCDNICLINEGDILLSGKLRDVKKNYGNNSIKIEYSGDASFIKTFPEIKHSNIFENYAEIIVNGNFSIKNFLDEANKKLEIRKFEVTEPSLHSIFVDKVGDSTKAKEASL
jgi:ABC-2 type transport system ATP-binding protein